MADAAIINKIDSAAPQDILEVMKNIKNVNPDAVIIEGASPLIVDKPELITGKRVLVVEDGPTLTHGEMKYGAGIVAAQKNGAKEIIDPRPFVVNSIKETFKKYPSIGTLLPAMGYGAKQIKDLETTINKTDCDSVLIGTPVDLGRILKINKPSARVQYELQEIGNNTLEKVLEAKGLL